VYFKVVSAISDIETIARGKGVRDGRRLKRLCGGSFWRKMKGVAARWYERLAEIHWYEAHGIGRKVLKIKRYLDTAGA
jgi:hypothetical protein